MKYIKTALFEEMLTLYSVTSLREKANPAHILQQMEDLAAQAAQAIPKRLNRKQKIHRLLQLFYGDWGFYSDENQYYRERNLFLPNILANREGIGVTLGGIFLYLANKLNLPVYPVNFPTQLILRAEIKDEVAFINPLNGQYISHKELQLWFEGAIGFGVPMTEEHIGIANEAELIERFRMLAKQTLIREQCNDEAFSYIEHLSLTCPDDLYHIRDRGIVLAQLGCLQTAIADFDTFIQQCLQDPSAFLLKMQLSEMKQELQTYSLPLH